MTSRADIFSSFAGAGRYRDQAFTIAHRTKDAYSTLAYRSWMAVAEAVLRMGFTPEETEAILRSKITRWARDNAKDYRYGTYPASVVVDYIKRNEAQCRADAKRWAEEAKPRSEEAAG